MKENFNELSATQEISPEEKIKKLKDKLYNRTATLVAMGVLFAGSMGVVKYKKEQVTKDAEKIKTILKQSNIVHIPPKDITLPKEITPDMSKTLAGVQSHVPEMNYTTEVYNDLSDEDAKQIDDILLDIQKTIGADSDSDKE